MMIAVEVPDEIYDDTSPVPMVCTPDGEMLARAADLPAGAWAASVLESVEVTRLSSWDLPNYLRTAARVQAWAASCVDTAVAELAGRRDTNVAADAEVSLALREPLRLAQNRIHRAQRLRVLLPAFKRAFSHGDLSDYDVTQLVEATSHCDDPEVLIKVQEKTLQNQTGQSGKELRRYARRLLDRLDPASASRRAQKARAAADVTLHPGEDGMASVVTDQPVEDAMIVKAAVDAKAITAKQAGDARPIGVLRAEALTQLCSDYLTGATGGAAPRSGGRPIEIGIVGGVRTALRIDELPGEVPAAGIVPRDAIAEMVATELPRLRLLVVDDNPHSPGFGRLIYRGHDCYRPTAEQVAHVRAAYPTSLGPFDRPWHNRKTRGSLSVTVDDNGAVTVTTVLGQTRTIHAYDYSPHLDSTLAADATQNPSEPPPF